MRGSVEKRGEKREEERGGRGEGEVRALIGDTFL